MKEFLIFSTLKFLKSCSIIGKKFTEIIKKK
jgi:hypothetical protein